MGTPQSHDPEQALERTTEELEERLETLDTHIHEAEQKAEDLPGVGDTLPTGAEPPGTEGGDAPETVEGRRDGDDEQG